MTTRATYRRAYRASRANSSRRHCGVELTTEELNSGAFRAAIRALQDRHYGDPVSRRKPGRIIAAATLRASPIAALFGADEPAAALASADTAI